MKTFSCVLRYALFALGVGPALASAVMFTVSNTGDSGSGTLRQAILDANSNAGLDEIVFAIPGTGVHTIDVASLLPGITSPVLIDGYTQPGSAPNNLAIGTNAHLRIEVEPVGGGAVGSGVIFLVGSSGSTVRGLVVHGFSTQIDTSGACDDCVIAGNFLGTDPSGTIGYPGSPGTRAGIGVGADRCRVGGIDRADRNLVSGLSNTGIHIAGSDDVVQGNLIGTDAGGSVALGDFDGIEIGAIGGSTSPTGALIGGTLGESGNVISGNLDAGILIASGESISVVGNLIGLAAFPLATVPNQGPGIWVQGGSLSNIGSQASAQANSIVGNAGPGVLLTGTATQGLFIVGNAIFSNAGLPIDLGVEGVTPNDPLDTDDGPNSLQNFPELLQITYTATETHVHGRLASAPDDVYRIDLYTAPFCDASGHGGASTYLGVAVATTDLSGNADFEFVVPSILDTGVVTATASRSEDLATSEFSACLGLGDRIFADGFD